MNNLDILLYDFWERVLIAAIQSNIKNSVEVADAAVLAWRERWTPKSQEEA